MTKRARDVLHRALELPESDRARLARRILESLDEKDDEEELDPDFAKELERRLSEEPPPGARWPTVDEVLDRLRRELKLPRVTKRRRGA